MDFFDFMFPEQAEASHLRSISAQLARSNRARSRGSRTAQVTAKQVADLEQDIGFLSMVLLAVIKRLAENETMTVADLADLFGEIDGLDGRADGALDVNVLRGALGAVRAAETEAADGADGADGAEQPRYKISSGRRFQRHRQRR